MNTTLEEQLFDLDLSVPPDLSSRAIARAATPLPHRRRRPRGRTVIAGVGAGALFVGANVAAAEYVPAYREFIQVMPFGASSSDRAQQAAGIPRDGLVPVDQSLPGEEFNLTVVGTYADELRTVVLIRVEPHLPGAGDVQLPYVAIWGVQLIDADGNVYEGTGGTGADDDRGRVTAMDFEPLQGAAARGAPVTLSVFELVAHGGSGQSYKGNWEFTLTMEQRQARTLPMPPDPMVSGDTEFIITSLQVSGTNIVIEWEARGGAVERFERFQEENPHPWPTGRIMDANARAHHIHRMNLWPQFISSQFGGVTSTGRASDGDFVDGVYYGKQTVSLLRYSPVPTTREQGGYMVTVYGDYEIRFGQFSEDGAPNFSESSPGWPITIPDDPPPFVSP